MINLEIGKTYNLLIYGICNRFINVVYDGVLINKTVISNEVHGFKGIHGIYAVTKFDLTKRVKNYE